MSDRPKDISTTPPPTQFAPNDDWERHLTFRHTFLVHLPPDVADALEDLGRGLYHLVLARTGGGPTGSWTQARLRATVADLRFHAAYLRDLARERQVSSLPEGDALLSDRARAWSDQVQALAARIESALP